METAEHTVSVELPEPGAARDVGLNEAVAPAGRPETARATAELKVPFKVELTVVEPQVPGDDGTVAGAAEMVKLAAGGGLTVSERLVECTRPLALPVTLTLVVPTLAVVAAHTVSAELPEPTR